jgi:predicted  nucleic acid-binding Zn-ribbon protein
MEHYSNVVKAMIARSNARAADIADKIQARAYYQFQYVPPAGPLPGWSMEQQTEDAINEIGNIAYSSDEIAREAREIAQQAYNAAQAAIEMATNAITAAQNAQQTADTALNTANTAVSKADNAQASADAAQKAADAAQKSANDAQTSADNAQSTANTAIENASQALSAANEAKASADQSNQRLDVLEPIVDTLRWYENVTDNIDFNTHVELERAFLQGTANTNGPIPGPGWLDVDDDYNETYIRQKFIAQADGACYVRFGTIVPDSSPIEVSSWTGWVKYALASELTSAVETINTSITSINGEITTIKGDITSIESDITELQGSLGSAEGDIAAVTNALDAHKADYDNPHKVTAAQLGLATVYKYKGSVETYADLPTSDQQVGDVYNVKQADPDHNIEAGDNVAWDGTTWDILAGDTDLSGYAQLNSANTFTAMNAFRANIAVSNGAAAGSSGTIYFGVSPTGETVQARIGTDNLGGLFYRASTNQPHIFRVGTNNDVFAIRDDDTKVAFSSNNIPFATVTHDGVAKWLGNATTATTATKLGSSTVGSGVRAIYLNAGTATASNSTVGDSTTPVYLKAGTITACDANTGSGWTVSEGSAGWARENSTGFTIQWGDTTTFPRTFTTAFQVVMQTNNNKGEQLYKNQVTVTSISNNGFTIGSPGQGQRYVAFGIS